MEVERTNDFARKGVAGAGLGLGIAGTALGLMNGGFGNLFGGCGANMCSDNMPVSRYDAEKSAKIAELQAMISLRDANTYNDQKMLELYKYIDGELRDVRRVQCEQALHNQRTEDAFAMARQDIALEAERRCCGDNSILNYANATFYPKMVADVTTGTTTTAQTLYNPIPCCGK